MTEGKTVGKYKHLSISSKGQLSKGKMEENVACD